MRLIDADKLYPDCLTKNGRLAISGNQIANAPTVEPKLTDDQIEKITDLLETEWGYEGIREDVSRILRGDEE